MKQEVTFEKEAIRIGNIFIKKIFMSADESALIESMYYVYREHEKAQINTINKFRDLTNAQGKLISIKDMKYSRIKHQEDSGKTFDVTQYYFLADFEKNKDIKFAMELILVDKEWQYFGLFLFEEMMEATSQDKVVQ